MHKVLTGILLLISIWAIGASADATHLIGVDIRDIVKYKSKIIPVADIILKSMVKDSEAWFPEDIQLSLKGPGFEAETRSNTVYGVQFDKEPIEKDDTGLIEVNLTALIHTDDDGFFFRKYIVSIEKLKNKKMEILNIIAGEDIPLKDVQFQMRVGLIQRKLVIESTSHPDIKMIYPLGVGGIDHGISAESEKKLRLMTPQMPDSLVLRASMMESRTDPDYFEGRLFIRIWNRINKGNKIIVEYTDYAFHGKIDSVLNRGFVSHGCMRMRDKDLYELYALIKFGMLKRVPLSLGLLTPDIQDNPYPLLNSKYNTVKNFGSKDSPKSGLDEENLTAMQYVHKKVPLDELIKLLDQESVQNLNVEKK